MQAPVVAAAVECSHRSGARVGTFAERVDSLAHPGELQWDAARAVGATYFVLEGGPHATYSERGDAFAHGGSDREL